MCLRWTVDRSSGTQAPLVAYTFDLLTPVPTSIGGEPDLRPALYLWVTPPSPTSTLDHSNHPKPPFHPQSVVDPSAFQIFSYGSNGCRSTPLWQGVDPKPAQPISHNSHVTGEWATAPKGQGLKRQGLSGASTLSPTKKECPTNVSNEISQVSLKLLHKQAIKMVFDEAFSDSIIISRVCATL